MLFRSDRLIEQAFAANTDLRVAEANLERSLALLDQRNAGREIQGSANAETSWAQRSAEAELSHVKPPTRQIYNMGIGASYDLDLFGGIKRGIEAASADANAAVAARDLVRVTVAAETARAYADICNAGYQRDVLGRAIAVLEQSVRLTRIMVSHGRAAPYELDRRQALLEASQARLPQLVARQRNALFRATALAGRMPSDADPGLLACHLGILPIARAMRASLFKDVERAPEGRAWRNLPGKSGACLLDVIVPLIVVFENGELQ